jgi:hypothetical protein
MGQKLVHVASERLALFVRLQEISSTLKAPDVVTEVDIDEPREILSSIGWVRPELEAATTANSTTTLQTREVLSKEEYQIRG